MSLIKSKKLNWHPGTEAIVNSSRKKNTRSFFSLFKFRAAVVDQVVIVSYPVDPKTGLHSADQFDPTIEPDACMQVLVPFDAR